MPETENPSSQAPLHPDLNQLFGALSGRQTNSGTDAGLISKIFGAKSSAGSEFRKFVDGLADHGPLDQAIASIHNELLIKPDYAEAYNNLGLALHAEQRWDEAATCYRLALATTPDFAQSYYNLGTALQALGLLDAAATSYDQALLIYPDYPQASNNKGYIRQVQGQLGEAATCYREAMLSNPDFALAYINLGNVLNAQGRPAGATACYRQALWLQPDYSNAYDSLLFLHAYQATLNSDDYLDLARGWEVSCIPMHARQLAAGKQFHRLPLVGRRLKIGYVSGDYCYHSVSYFLKKIFAGHARMNVELYAYATNTQHDTVTDEFKALADHWVPIAGLDDAAAVQCIEADGIDVLIDVSGHTKLNRLGVFALRAAPVQAHYLGFFGSTGLSEMDYWIGDEVLTPPELDTHFTERVWRLPSVWVSYEGNTAAPQPGWKPDPNGTVWLGSFNNLSKLTPATLALWARVLRAMPEGRLLLKTKELADETNRRRILESFASQGIAANRIELQDTGITPGWTSHMAYYDRLDIALDPVGGVGGGTTTCDALWMAVPIITLRGDRMASCMTASMVHAIGQPEWVALSEDEYLDKIVALARDVDLRTRLRSGQRTRMAQSPLCDSPGLARNLENAYRNMFEHWLDKQPPFATDEKSVVLIGDSITKGTYRFDDQIYKPFAARIAEALPSAYPAFRWRVHNEGVDGSSTRDWVDWIDSRVSLHKPTAVVIFLGINDSADDTFSYHVAPGEFRNNLQFILNKIRSQNPGARIVLINIPPINLNKDTWGRTDPYRAQYRVTIRSIAEVNHCKLVDIFEDLDGLAPEAIPADGYFDDDGLHLSDRYHLAIYNALLPILCMDKST